MTGWREKKGRQEVEWNQMAESVSWSCDEGVRDQQRGTRSGVPCRLQGTSNGHICFPLFGLLVCTFDSEGDSEAAEEGWSPEDGDGNGRVRVRRFVREWTN